MALYRVYQAFRSRIKVTTDSLSVFSRVRLYTAIYPQGDVVENTESLLINSAENPIKLPVLSLEELPLKRLPSINPLRYQSPIALLLGAKAKADPQVIARTICQRSLLDDGISHAPHPLQLSYNDRGWITLTWDRWVMYETLRALCESSQIHDRLSLEDCPFWLWHVSDRSRSIIEQLRCFYSDMYGEVAMGEVAMGAISAWPVPAQDLLEAIVIFFDRLSTLDTLESQTAINEYRSLSDAFTRMHQQISLFSPKILKEEQQATFLVLECFQALLKKLENL